MSDLKHTPGPWEPSHQLAEGFSVAHEIAPGCGHLQVVAICPESPMRLGHKITEDNARANARLIAASPELLEALRNAGAWITMFSMSLEHEQQAVQVLEQARAAIAKATGSKTA